MMKKIEIINLIHQASTNSTDCFLIIGYGITGVELAKFFDSKNINYYIIDNRDDLVCDQKNFMGHLKIDTELNHLKSHCIKAVFPSPGVALTHPAVQKAKKTNIPIIGELELASLFLKGDFIAVTGTNGKSTTVKLINALLKDAGFKTGLKGNIGSPLISAVNETPKSFYVIEESSFQLELTGSLHHKIAICLNVTEDHFERYPSLAEYALAKANIIKNSDGDDYFIYNHDDRPTLNMSLNSAAQNIPFSLVNEFDEGAFVKGKQMVIKVKNQQFSFDLEKCSLKGLHNIENMLAALTAVILINHENTAITSYAKTLKNFVGLPHRLEKIHSWNGVDYYDDSKATNVGSVVMALASFSDNIILIAGGKDKLCDFSPLKGIVKGKVKKLIILGEAKERMFEVLRDTTNTEIVENMAEAVLLAFKTASSGDTVLLSPTCSSFDQYENYKMRGEDFCKRVKNICGRGNS